VTAAHERELWLAYKGQGDLAAREELIVGYMGATRREALSCAAARACESLDDVISEAYVAMIQCVDRFDVSRGLQFMTYVTQRIRGSVLDLARAAKLATYSELPPEDSGYMLAAPVGGGFRDTEDELACGTLLRELPLGWRCFIVLRVLEGFTHEEVRHALGFSLVRSHQLVGLIRKRLVSLQEEGRWPWRPPN